MAVQTLLQVRRGTTSEWINANPTLSAGEWGYDSTTKRYKIGDGLTQWNSLPYASILPNSSNLVGNSGIGITFAATTGIPVTVSVTGITASQINDFNSAVDARITNAAVSEEEVQDIIASGDHVTTGFLRNGTGIVIDYNDASNFVTINVSGYSLLGHTHDDRYYTETELSTSGGGGQVHWNNVTSTPTGFTPVSHNHIWSQITDASATASLSELAYLSGVTAGTASANRAVVLDSNKNINGIGSITTTGNINIGGNLVVNGTTTTVNSTTVDIGDNIIQVNVSGAETQGGLQVYDHDNTIARSLVWDINNTRWQFTGGNVYTSGDFISNSLQVSSTGLVSNLNADLLDGQHGSYYRNFINLTGLPDPIITGTLTGDVTGTGSVTLTDLANGTLSISTTLADNTVTSAKIVNGTIVDADINATAAIAVTKLASSGITLGSTTVNLGQTSTVIDGLTRISGVSAGNPTYIYYAVIDGGSP